MADVATLIVGAAFKGSDFVAHGGDALPGGVRGPELDLGAVPPPQTPHRAGGPPGPGWLSWSDLEAGDPASRREVEARSHEARPTDVYNIQFTSGTTGMPKGAMLTHRNVLMNAYLTGERLHYTADDRVCVPVPFYHCFGCVLGTLVCAVYGSAIVVPAPSFDARATLAAIDAERCTSVYGVPTMYVARA